MEKNNLAKNALNEIVKLIDNKYDISQDLKLRENTPNALVCCGVKDLPMLMNSSHLLNNILTEKQAKEMNIYNKSRNYHELGVKKFLEIINNLDSVEKIFRKNNSNDYIFLMPYYSNVGDKIIVPIYANTKGNYDNKEIDTNKIKTVYGKKNLNSYLKRNIKNGTFSIIFDAKKQVSTTGVRFSNDTHLFVNSNISQNVNNVNSDIPYYMQSISIEGIFIDCDENLEVIFC